MSEHDCRPLEATESAEERWLPVVGHEDAYEVSDQGRVRSLTRTITCSRIHGKSGKWETYSRTIKGQLLKPSYSNPYLMVCLPGPGHGQKQRLHRLVLDAFVGPLPKGMVTRHLNGNHTDNRLDNLVYGTYSENGYDMVRHGRGRARTRTDCLRGHEYTEENTLITPAGKRRCRQCAREWQRERRAAMPPKTRRRKVPRTACAQGHELSPENVYEHDGRRRCRQCARARSLISNRTRVRPPRKKLPPAPRKPKLLPCGTESAYGRHRRNGEDCAECRAAVARAVGERRRKRMSA